MHGRTDNVKTVYPLQTKFAGGIKSSAYAYKRLKVCVCILGELDVINSLTVQICKKPVFKVFLSCQLTCHVMIKQSSKYQLSHLKEINMAFVPQ